VPSPGILNNISGNQVSMTADFSASAETAFQWQWAAAAYNTFGTDYNSLGVLPTDVGGLHAGTPANFADSTHVDKGGSGGGGSNFTGSLSATASCDAPAVVPEPSSAMLLCIGAFVLIRRTRRSTAKV
jgi:hypothetical protein